MGVEIMTTERKDKIWHKLMEVRKLAGVVQEVFETHLDVAETMILSARASLDCALREIQAEREDGGPNE
jgi:hypothetical protein